MVRRAHLWWGIGGCGFLHLDALPFCGGGGGGDGSGGTLLARSFEGLLGEAAVWRLVAAATAAIESGEVPWAVLTVWGFADAPVSWGLEEHTATLGGAENDYVVVVLPGGRCLRRYASCGSTRDFVCEAKV